jgi:peptidylprolyl isomerase
MRTKRIVILLCFGFVLALLGCSKSCLGHLTRRIDQQNAQFTEAESRVVDLQIQDVSIGRGPEFAPDKNVTVKYVGTFLNGTLFDSSFERGQMFTFKSGKGVVIEGWEKGMQGMKVGGRRKYWFRLNLLTVKKVVFLLFRQISHLFLTLSFWK